MKTGSDDDSILIEYESDLLEPIIHYGVLSVQSDASRDIEKVARHFGLKVRQTIMCYELAMPEAVFGEHKLHCVTLLAAALFIHKILPQARMHLETRCDFEKVAFEKSVDISYDWISHEPGSLSLTNAPQVFLHQAGFELKPAEKTLILSPADLEHQMAAFLKFADVNSMKKGA